MSAHDEPPFAADERDRREIWEMLAPRDTDAYLNQDWGRVAGDFVSDGFFGIDARRDPNPDRWRIAFPTLAAYRQEWLRQAETTARTVDRAPARAAFLSAVTLVDIQIDGDFALAHKIFDGRLPNRDGSYQTLDWQTLYVCRRHEGRWKIASFVGYMPRGAQAPGLTHAPTHERAHFPAATQQHKTAGPYTPVVGVEASARIFVISGQAPLDLEGRVVGESIAEQSHLTLQNCRTQLEAAGCALSDVFKATVYMTDLAHWGAFNEVYREYMQPPYPARTAVQTGLLPGMLVEVEMWAAKR